MVTFEHLEKMETISADGDESETDWNPALRAKRSLSVHLSFILAPPAKLPGSCLLQVPWCQNVQSSLILRIPSNCERHLDLLAFDPDGDEVKCRYGSTELSECNPCTAPSVLTLASVSCQSPQWLSFELISFFMTALAVSTDTDALEWHHYHSIMSWG